MRFISFVDTGRVIQRMNNFTIAYCPVERGPNVVWSVGMEEEKDGQGQTFRLFFGPTRAWRVFFFFL